MREYVITLLKQMEEAIAPPQHCHHALTYARYGSDESGWVDKLALQVNQNGSFHCFFIDEGDDLNPPEDIVAEIVGMILIPDPGEQLGAGFGQYKS